VGGGIFLQQMMLANIFKGAPPFTQLSLW